MGSKIWGQILIYTYIGVYCLDQDLTPFVCGRGKRWIFHGTRYYEAFLKTLEETQLALFL